MKFIAEIYRKITRQVTPAEVAIAELQEAELKLMQAESGVEYAQSIVVYNQARIRRLKKMLNEMSSLPNSGS